MVALSALWMGAALAGFEGMSPDVVAVGDVTVEPVTLTARLADLRRGGDLWDEACAVGWTSTTADRAWARWTPGPMNRKVALAVVELQPGRKVKWEAEGDRGFFVHWRVEAREGGSRVTVETPLLAPPWPVRGVFYRKVQPAWKACYEQAIRRLGAP